MKFDDFIARIDLIAQSDSFGTQAHDVILPEFARQRIEAMKKDNNPKLSGVAAIVYREETDANILLIERQSYEGVHSAQIGFPGGKKEDIDNDLESTARREMQEEVGIPSDEPTLIRKLSKVYIPPSRFLVQPYLFHLEALPKLILDSREVKLLVKFPIKQLLEDSTVQNGSIQMTEGLKIKTPYFFVEGHKVWGATAMMLNELKLILKSSLK